MTEIFRFFESKTRGTSPLNIIYIYPHTNGEMFRNIVANESCGQGNAISGLAQGQSDVAAKVIRTKSRQKG